MDKNQKNYSENLLDRAVDSLRQSSTPAGPPEATLETVLDAAPPELVIKQKSTLSQRIYKMKPYTRIAAAILIITGIATLITTFSIIPSGSKLFAEVVEPILTARTIYCKLGLGDTIKTQVMFSDTNRIREISPINGDITILDFETSELLTMDPAKKIATRWTLKQFDEVPEIYTDMIKKVEDILDDPHQVVEELGEDLIDGRQVFGLHAGNPDDPSYSVTVWADVETELPVKIEHQLSDVRLVFTEIQFEETLDESLFSLEIPDGFTFIEDGYTVLKTQMEMEDISEQDLLSALKATAKLNDDLFPDALDNWPEQIDAFELADEDDLKLRVQVDRALAFLETLTEESHWNYSGANVALNDGEQPIFRYRVDDSDHYRTAYGDLVVKLGESLPAAREVLERYLDVTGGREPWDNVQNLMMVATMKTLGMKGTITKYLEKPNKFYIKVKMVIIGTIERGSDGETIWQKHPTLGTEIFEGKEKAAWALINRIDLVSNYEQLFKKVECVGIETIDDDLCYKVVLTPYDVDPLAFYFSVETGLERRFDFTLPVQNDQIPVITLLGDHRPAGDFLVPYGFNEKAMGIDSPGSCDSIEYNTDLPKGIFELPDEVRILLGGHNLNDPRFIGNESDQWHITDSGNIVAHSQVVLTAWPQDASTINVTLPYATGELQTVQANQQDVSFAETRNGQYQLDLPQDLFTSDRPTLELTWTFPFSSLEHSADGYRAKLQTVIPATSFKMEFVLDPGCGFVRTDDPSLTRMRHFNWTNETPKMQMGSVGMMIRKE